LSPIPNWKDSPKHLLLLAEFVQPRDPEDVCRARKWQAVFGDDLRQAIRLFGQERLIIRCSLEEHLNYAFGTPALQTMLKERRLPVPGTRSEMIGRLVFNDREGMKQAVAKVFVLRCSEHSQAVVERFLDEQRRVHARIESQVAEVLKKGKLEEACRKVAAFEASQVFPRDSDADWEHYNPDQDLAVLRTIADCRPKVFARLGGKQLGQLRIAASLMHLWKVNKADEWLPGSFRSGLSVDNAAAVRMLAAHAVYRTDIARYQESHIGVVRIYHVGDGLVCDACRALEAATYPIDRVPELPYEQCTCHLGCRCFVRPISAPR
jgi:hypothetical protein